MQLRSPIVVCALAGVSVGLFAQDANAFWFWCKGKDAVMCADLASQARKIHYDRILSPTSTEDEIAAAKSAADFLTKNTLDKTKDFATSVPGTSFTGPPNVKSLAKQLVIELLKEAAQKASGNSQSKLSVPPSPPAGVFDTVSPIYAASTAGQLIPITAPAGDDSVTVELSYLTLADYDGSEGPLPPTFDSPTYTLMKGTFSGMFLSDFDTWDKDGNMSVFTASLFSSAIASEPDLAGFADFGGGLAPEILMDVPGSEEDPMMVSGIEITSINPSTGEISGVYYSISIPAPGSVALGAIGLVVAGVRRRR